MAKKRAESDASTARPAGDDRVMVAQIKGPTEFRDWVVEAAEFARTSVVALIEVALVEKMERMNFPKPAPKRRGSR